MPGRDHHVLTITNRGGSHVHVWLPSCECGWIGVPRRRQREAEGQYHTHVEARQRPLPVPRYGPRPVTPFDRLPDELRV